MYTYTAFQMYMQSVITTCMSKGEGQYEKMPIVLKSDIADDLKKSAYMYLHVHTCTCRVILRGASILIHYISTAAHFYACYEITAYSESAIFCGSFKH